MLDVKFCGAEKQVLFASINLAHVWYLVALLNCVSFVLRRCIMLRTQRIIHVSARHAVIC